MAGKSAGGFEDILGGLFGGGAGRTANRKRKGESVQHVISVSLEELFKGSTRYIDVVFNLVPSICCNAVTCYISSCISFMFFIFL